MAQDGQLRDIVLRLTNTVGTKDDAVRTAVSKSLQSLGLKQPEFVLTLLMQFLTDNKKITQQHRVDLLLSLHRILDDKIALISRTLAGELITFASVELTFTSTIVVDWQGAASSILVSLSTQYGEETLTELLTRFSTGITPHFYVVETLGKVVRRNIQASVPRMRDVFSRLIPLLGAQKSDNKKWVFAATICLISESINDYLENTESKSEDHEYVGEVWAAYDIMFNSWMHSKDSKVRLAVVECMGHLYPLLDPAKLEESVPKLVPCLLGMYKRHSEHLHITESFYFLLETVHRNNQAIYLEQFHDTIINTFHSAVCSGPDPKNPKNFNELLRCFEILAKMFVERLVVYLFNKLENTTEKVRIGTLTIVKHLIYSADEEMQTKRETIVVGLRILFNDQNVSVKKVFAQVIIAMANKQYLCDAGSETMITFIVDQCVASSKAVSNVVETQQLQVMCEKMLTLITSTISSMHHVLWPFLLKFVLKSSYTSAMSVLCQNCTLLANQSEETPDKEDSDHDKEDVDNEESALISEQQCVRKSVLSGKVTSSALFSRLLVLLAYPLKDGTRGTSILKLLIAMTSYMPVQIQEVLSAVLPKLLTHLVENNDQFEWEDKSWEDLVLRTLSKVLDVNTDSIWLAEVGESLILHLTSLYPDLPQERNFAMKCIGKVIKKSEDKKFVIKALDNLMSSVSHRSQLDKEGAAVAVGFAAEVHCDEVLNKLGVMVREELPRKSAGLLGFIKDKTEADVDRIKGTLLLCYGYTALFGPPHLILPRLNSQILTNVLPLMSCVKDPLLKQNVIKCIKLLGTTMHPSHTNNAEYTFAKRVDVLKCLVTFVNECGQDSNELKCQAIDAAATLALLNPVLERDELNDLIQTFSTKIMSLNPNVITVDLHTKCMNSFTSFLCASLGREPTIDMLYRICSLLGCFTNSTVAQERVNSSLCLLRMSEFLLEKMSVMSVKEYSDVGSLLAVVSIRCSDSSVDVRIQALNSLKNILILLNHCLGQPSNIQDIYVDAINTFTTRSKQNNAQTIYSVVNDLAKILAKKIPGDFLIPFIYSLLDGLLDSESWSSSGACVVLTSLFKQRGSELEGEIEHITVGLRSRLSKIKCPQTHTGTLRLFRVLCLHHLSSVTLSLLSSPPDTNMRDLWRMLVSDSSVSLQIVGFFYQQLKKTSPYSKDDDEGVDRTANPKHVAIMCALKEMISGEDVEELLDTEFEKILSVTLLQIAVFLDTQTPSGHCDISPILVSKEVLMTLLVSSRKQALCDELETLGSFIKISKIETLSDGVTDITRCLCEHCPEKVTNIMTALRPHLASIYDNQRVVVTAFMSEFVRMRCLDNTQTMDSLISTLMGKTVDSSVTVRKLCIRGLSNVSTSGSVMVQRFAISLLPALVAALDDRDDVTDNMTLESLSGLNKIVPHLDEESVSPILINLAMRVRPAFEKEQGVVRAEAFTLFGELSKFGDGASKEAFEEQAHTNLITLLLHLNEEDDVVVKACKNSLKKIGPYLGSSGVNSMFQKHLITDARLHYGDFINDLSKILVVDFEPKINMYIMSNVSFFKSRSLAVQRNAVLFVGYMLSALPTAAHYTVSIDTVVGFLLKLLKDSPTAVKISAAEALGMLHNLE